jgi:hypothetical protein
VACQRWCVPSITLCHFAFKLTCNWLHISGDTKGYSSSEHTASRGLEIPLVPEAKWIL